MPYLSFFWVYIPEFWMMICRVQPFQGSMFRNPAVARKGSDSSGPDEKIKFSGQIRPQFYDQDRSLSSILGNHHPLPPVPSEIPKPY
ncbi:hypothetical protein J6590_007393 [Homalodisca vitripennis]|nr:hypothetical protein J6590_007393 [Homalodisca vitripennis]